MVLQFAQRAWRRPLTLSEQQSLTALWRKLEGYLGDEEALAMSLQAILTSSKFLYRPSLESLSQDTSGNWVPVDDYVLASRLSYFIWSTMPDDALMAEAAAGTLRTTEGLKATVARMLASPQARGLRDGFAASWLGSRTLETAAPDATEFPTFDQPLRKALAEEAELFFADFLKNGLPIQKMLTAPFGFMNDRLAAHYGLPPPGSAELTKVSLSSSGRGGILTQGAWLTAVSDPLHTSPVRRGRWVLENMLGMNIPPPPPGIPALPAKPAGGEPAPTVRELLAEHRANPVCASCHDAMDPIGLGLEEFDAIGRKRDTEAGRPVDSSGALDGQAFAGATQLAAIIEKDPRFVTSVVSKLYAYALGRERLIEDGPFLAELEKRLIERGGRLDSLVELIVLSPPFRMHPEVE